ncbi:PaiB family negative transcriptional regulator [Murinocardiopsis flavida]|uniref:PaiB family negative transcriptional regulator n=1 Tax=Murinocardiopsis flavida TaxID=645275 RepID=A0A2P8DSW1_9ACTN|nr:FMN-binding negative transcriptional regulator [Murinocardiopsis flavida]PSL00302.1 PaiB family negative transcriptional regulator [Murinocardiopsis flavida]
MHEFERYSPDDPRHAVELVRTHPFALVVSADGGVPVATHVPVVADPATPVGDSFAGATLLGHMARANPQWRSFAAAPDVLAVFSGPDSYVSPTTYGRDPSVPTWNYAAVHLTGRVEVADGPDDTLAVLEETVRALESLRSPSWDMAASRGRFAELVSGVVAFRIRVSAQRSVFKLGQDLPADLHDRVHGAAAEGPHAAPELAELMRRVDPRAHGGGA